MAKHALCGTVAFIVAYTSYDHFSISSEIEVVEKLKLTNNLRSGKCICFFFTLLTGHGSIFYVQILHHIFTVPHFLSLIFSPHTDGCNVFCVLYAK